MINLKEYEDFVTKSHKPGNDLITFVLGLSGECGEVTEIFKKARRDQKVVNVHHLREELGDVLWYLINIARVYNLSLEEIITNNIIKLKNRYDYESLMTDKGERYEKD